MRVSNIYQPRIRHWSLSMRKPVAFFNSYKNQFKLAAIVLLLQALSACSQDSGDTTSISVTTSSETTGGAVDIRSSVSDLAWPLHNFDLYGSRFAPTDQVTKDNVGTLTPRWLFQHGVIDGVATKLPLSLSMRLCISPILGAVYTQLMLEMAT